VSRGLGALYSLSHLARGLGRVKIHRRHLALHPEIMMKVLKISGSGMFQLFIHTASWVGLVRIISTFGSDAVAGYTIGIRVVLFALFPAFGLSNAAATMVGQSLGAGKPERAERSVWLTSFYNLGFLGSMGVVFLLFAPVIVHWFSTVADVATIAVSCLRVVSSGFLFYAFGMVMGQSFNGAGDTWTPTWINFFVFWAFEIPAAWVLAKGFHLGPPGVFVAILLAFSLHAVVGTALFRRGGWKRQTV
jgi:Na+-driven multidrug efflux pump